MATTKARFTRALHAFLIQQGYSYIYSKGIIAKPGEMEEAEDYILIPLKPGDPRLQYQETDMHIDEINSPDILEMLGGDEFISFFVEMPVTEYDYFYLKNK